MGRYIKIALISVAAAFFVGLIFPPLNLMLFNYTILPLFLIIIFFRFNETYDFFNEKLALVTLAIVLNIGLIYLSNSGYKNDFVAFMWFNKYAFVALFHVFIYQFILLLSLLMFSNEKFRRALSKKYILGLLVFNAVSFSLSLWLPGAFLFEYYNYQ